MIDGHAFLGSSIYIEQNPEEFIADMDRLGIQISVVVAPPPGPFYSNANRLVEEAARDHPKRLVPLYRINPHLEGEANRARGAITEGGFKGLKLDPTNDGYGVGGDFLDPYIVLAEEVGVPIYIHSGDSIFCPPEAIADLAGSNQKVNFVTNASRRVHRAARDLCNLYILTRPFPTLAFQRGYAERFDLDRLIFASDSPLGKQEIEFKAVELAGIEEETREKILGGNLSKIMNI